MASTIFTNGRFFEFVHVLFSRIFGLKMPNYTEPVKVPRATTTTMVPVTIQQTTQTENSSLFDDPINTLLSNPLILILAISLAIILLILVIVLIQWVISGTRECIRNRKKRRRQLYLRDTRMAEEANEEELVIMSNSN